MGNERLRREIGGWPDGHSFLKSNLGIYGDKTRLSGEASDEKWRGERGFVKCWRELPMLLKDLYLRAGISDFKTEWEVPATAVSADCIT
jgi:hypothetical protein